MSKVPDPPIAGSVPPASPTTLAGSGEPLAPGSGSSDEPQTTSQATGANLLSKTALRDLVMAIDPSQRLEPDVENLLMEVAEEFIGSVLQESCELARHRNGQVLEVRDVQLHLERSWNIKIPGYSYQEVTSVKKPESPT
jgi:transcription initiation factor TFIID subunit 12